jgi:hypothetical protein
LGKESERPSRCREVRRGSDTLCSGRYCRTVAGSPPITTWAGRSADLDHSRVRARLSGVIEHIEAQRAKRRQEFVDASNSATRRAAQLKSGAGIGAATVGIGLGALLALYGVSLLINRPTLEEVAKAMHDQVATLERITNEKVEKSEAEATKRVAAAEKTATEKTAVAEVAVNKAALAEVEARTVTEKFGAPPSSKTVVDFTIFRKHQTNGLVVLFDPAVIILKVLGPVLI